MKNLLPEHQSSISNSRDCITLDTRDSTHQPTLLVEQRSSLLNKVSSSRPPRKINCSQPKLKRSQNQNPQPFIVHLGIPTDESVDKLIQMLLEKGKKVQDFLNINGLSEGSFVEQHFRCSLVVRAQLKIVLQKFISKGQVGADLKGVNRPILEKIEANIKEALQNQKDLYLIKSQVQKQSNNISKGLMEYKQKIIKSLGSLEKTINIR